MAGVLEAPTGTSMNHIMLTARLSASAIRRDSYAINWHSGRVNEAFQSKGGLNGRVSQFPLGVVETNQCLKFILSRTENDAITSRGSWLIFGLIVSTTYLS